MTKPRYRHRHLCVIQIAHVVMPTEYRVRSYPTKKDAYAAVDRIERKRGLMVSAFYLDRDNPGHVLLPGWNT